VREYIDRFDHLVNKYNRAKALTNEWQEINAEVLKETFIQCIKPSTLTLLVKQHLHKTLSEVQRILLKEFDEEEASEDLEKYTESEFEKTTRVAQNKGRYVRIKHEISTSNSNSSLLEQGRKSELEKKLDKLIINFQKLTLLVERTHNQQQA
ncbi:hypothetical protein BD560DRAFT_316358, partial [Blakeslea trispora]